MNVVVIPEDYPNDRHILRPIFDRLFTAIGRANTSVIISSFRLRGVSNALRSETLARVIARYPMADLFILCVDRDCNVNRRDRLDQIEEEFGAMFMAVNAWEEIETWVLAGLDTPSDWRWTDVRSECDVKESYFIPLAHQRGLTRTAGRGRKILGEEASRNIRAIRQKCPEDFDALAWRLENLT